MTATAAMILQVRRMTNEITMNTYLDPEIQGYIEEYPTLDARGIDPFWWNSATVPPTLTANLSWIPTYDLHAAAAAIWEQKAGVLAPDINSKTKGASTSQSQAYDHAMSMARFHNSQRNPGTITQRMKPDMRLTNEVIGNLPEQDDVWGGEPI